jgi:hypothetical protein
MPGRFAVRSGRAQGPSPFSSEWLASPPVAEPPARFRLPGWIPDRQIANAWLVVAVSLLTVIATLHASPVLRVSPSATDVSSPPEHAIAATEAPAAEVVDPAPAPESDDIAAPAGSAPESAAEPAAPGVSAPEFAQAPALAQANPVAVAQPPTEGALLPGYRIVAFYGHPHDANMGIVGEHEMEELASLLRDEAANYAAADPSRPVIPAFELIATVAQRVPGADGTYILDTDHETLTSYIDYAEQNGMLVILDLQVGRGTVANEIEKVRDLLARPNVHLAIDPEFAVKEGQIPGDYIGSVPAESIVYAQQALSDIATSNGIPPKMLIVHQFREDMIEGKDRLAPMPGVQLVIDADGFGAPELKTGVYNFLVRDEPVEFAGIKLFYKQDMPLMTPQEILALVPPPDVVIYQ